MEGISITNYSQYKQQADAVMQRMAEGFVEVGYILRLAKEQPELLDGSGYRDYQEFAEVEYNLEESTVSRFINMNIKYGDGPKLLPQYQGFGRAKLQDMLSLPGTVIEEIPKETTRTEIQEIKRDYEEEQKVTPIETALEASQYDDDMTMCQNFFVAYFRTNKEDYLKLPILFKEKMGDMKKPFMECFAPAGSAALRARVPGKGKVMLTIKSADSTPVFTEMRSGERLEYTWEDLLGDIVDVDWKEEYGKAGWEEFYGEPWEKTEEIAPVQSAPVIENTNTETTYPQEDTGETQQVHEDDRKNRSGEVENTPEKAEVYEDVRKTEEFPMNPPEIEKVEGEAVELPDNAVQSAYNAPQDAANWQQNRPEVCQKAAEETQDAADQQQNQQEVCQKAAEEEATGQQAEAGEQQEDPFFIVKGLRGKLFTLEGALNEGYTRTGYIIEDMIGDLKRLRELV